MGFGTLSISDHFVRGWSMDPLTTLAAAAMTTSRLRLLTLVLGNDYRHPALLHRSAATIDVLSGGRLELGVGAGWLAEDYRCLGLSFDEPSVRIDRLEESLNIVRKLFASETTSFAGRHYTLQDFPGAPVPVQRPHPPLLVGGGGPRMLRLAARLADIVGVHLPLPGGEIRPGTVAGLSSDTLRAKVRLVEQAAAEAGRADDIELQFSAYHVSVGNGDQRTPPGRRSTFSALIEAEPGLADSPAVLVGDVGACVERLQQHREEYGFSYWSLGSDLEAVAPVVARLAGT